jgi:hypothetical protein
VSGSILLTLQGVALLLHSAAAAGELEIIDAGLYRSGVCRIIVQNSGEELEDVESFHLLSGEGKPLVMLWNMAEPRLVEPGKTAFVSFYAKEAIIEGAAHFLALSTKRFSFSPKQKPIELTYAVWDPGEKNVCLFVRSQDQKEITVTGVTIGDEPVGLSGCVNVPSGQNRMVSGLWNMPDEIKKSVPQLAVHLSTMEVGTVLLFSRLYRPEHTVSITAESLPELFISCLSHEFDSPGAAGVAAVERACQIEDRLRTIKFCNFDVGNKVMREFGQIADAAQVQLQTVYDNECVRGQYIEPAFGAASLTKSSVEPGIFHVKIYARNAHNEQKPPYAMSVIRNIAYASIAAGAKGLALEPFSRLDLPGSFASALDRLLLEIDSIRPLIAVSDPVASARTSQEAWCYAHTLLCGQEGLLLILLPRQASTGAKPSRPAIVCLEACGFPALSPVAVEVGYLGQQLPVDRKGTGDYAITVPASGEARVFFVEAVNKT